MKITAVLFILVLALSSCKKPNEGSKILVADWLPGKWENKTADGNLLEIWKKTNDSIYDGASYFIKGKDTLHFETIQLIQKGEELLYISTIRGQNNDKPAIYKLLNSTEKQLVFENPKIEYPKKIVYIQISKDNLGIEISGTQVGKPSLDKYKMSRMK
jgi:hypothetical protein